MHEVVVELQQMVERNGWVDMFREAVANAAAHNVDAINHVDTLEDYYQWMNDLLYWVPSEDESGRVIYNRICMGCSSRDSTGGTTLSCPGLAGSYACDRLIRSLDSR